MQYLTACDDDIPQIKKLWNDNFDDGTPDFCNFIFDMVKNDKIYIAKDNNKIASMLMAAAELQYKKQKGFYLYSACTDSEYRGKGYMHSLVRFAIDDMNKRGFSFCVIKPASESLFDFYADIGFDKRIQLRKAEIEIKKNIWQSAEFDIATASRINPIREKYCDENTVYYTQKDCQNYAMYLYTYGGSSAENENAFAIYYTENDKLVVKELLSTSTIYATKLLQSIRERTGLETAQIYLSKDSTLFLGEGKLQDEYMSLGLSEEAYINLMFE